MLPVRIPLVLPHLRCALLALQVFFRIKQVKVRAFFVTQAHSAVALVSRQLAVYALQDRSPLAVQVRLPARPAPRANTAQLRVFLLAKIALLVLSQSDLLHPLPAPRVLLDFTAQYLVNIPASHAPRASTVRRRG